MEPKNRQYLKSTKSVCPVCLDIIDANVNIEKKKVVMSKTCRKHKNFRSLYLWDDPVVYKRLEKLFRHFQRDYNYPNGIIIDLTLKCNLNCSFCFARGTKIKFHEPDVKEIVEKILKSE